MHAPVEELDLKNSVLHRSVLPNQMVEAWLSNLTSPLFGGVGSSMDARLVSLQRQTKPHAASILCWSQDQV